MAFGGCRRCLLDHELMVLDLHLSHTLPFRLFAAGFQLCLFFSEMFFHITMDGSREHLDIAAAEVIYADIVVHRVAESLVFGAVGDFGQVHELGSGTRLARGDQHVIAKVVFLQSLGEVLKPRG